jgi:hypothetical protein
MLNYFWFWASLISEIFVVKIIYTSITSASLLITPPYNLNNVPSDAVGADNLLRLVMPAAGTITDEVLGRRDVHLIQEYSAFNETSKC